MMLAVHGESRKHKPMEHRWGDRVELDIPVTLAIGSEKVGLGLLRDASISGGFIATLTDLPTFTNLVVRVDRVELHACVMRRTPQGLGIEWRDMACPAVMSLLRRERREARLSLDVA